MNGILLRRLVEQNGVDASVRFLNEAIWRRENPIPVQEFSFKELWEAFVGPTGQTLDIGQTHNPFINTHREETSSQAFAYLTGNIIARRVQSEYDNLAASMGILSKLVSPYRSSLRTERVVGIQAFGAPVDIPEGKDYPEQAPSDRGTESPEPAKRGFMIEVTEETVFYDQTGQIMKRAAGISRSLVIDREARGMRQIQDLTSYKCFYPLVDNVPTQTDLYRSAAAGTAWYNKSINLKTTNGLVDWSNIDAAMKLLFDMVDEAGNNILTQSRILLVPRALWGTALMILGATQQNVITDTATTWTMSPNVLKLMGEGNLVPLTSPFMNDATTWYVGDPAAQFSERIIWPIQTVSMNPRERADCVAAFKVRRKSQIECEDDKNFIKNTA